MLILMAGLKEDESKHLLHLSLKRQLDFVRWNPVNQDEVFHRLKLHSYYSAL